ncbi:hypothetical protein DEJ51_17240 [Streptomyces venezuelae]|uniref:Uncharacterized protein n=1 Tax=Streptomyces venezuelae TaxID=54571 RepID=A0A5P2DKR6_STRVZ|nr:hypothetical protein [Streptomyces venezuelae]QES55702.1 hypothetical protein DEJ51_17240 [Streptomyces venezuelae]
MTAPTAPDALMVLDYPGRRPEAPVTALGLDGMVALLADPLPVEGTGPAYAARLDDGPGPVLAYCAASAIAVHLARRSGHPRPLVLFDPMPTTDDDVARGYADAVAQVPGGSEPPVPFGELPAAPEAFLRAVRQDLARRAEAALRAQGLDDEVTAGPVAHFTRQHLSYLAYLLAARGALPREPVGPVLQVLSRDHPDHGDWLPEGPLTTLRVDCDRAGLTAHETTRTGVVSFLSATTRRQHA